MKKPTCLLTFFLFFTISAQAQIDWQQVTDRYNEKYKPSETPDWVFPMIIEEGSGQQDTLYFLYDADIKPFSGLHPEYGENYEKYDSMLFNAGFGTGFFTNGTCLKINTFGAGGTNKIISFYRGVLPVKLFWDKSLFYSPELPFIDQGPRPKAEGRVSFDGPPMQTRGTANNPWCAYHFPVLLTDQLKPPGPSCYATDSLIFEDDLQRTTTPIGWLGFKIVQWTGNYTAIEENDSPGNFKIYPSPADQKLIIETPEVNNTIEIYDLFGRRLLTQMSGAHKTEINTSAFKTGIYFVQVYGEKAFARQKILIQH